jgi:DNA repair exonuclease SbcCD ATPase subunit
LEKVDIDSLDPDAELNRRKAAERAAELERQARIKAEEEARKEKERQKAEQEKKKKEAQKAEEEEPLNLGWNNINGQDVFISGVYGIFKIERKDDGIYVNGALVNGFSKTDSYFSYRADGRTITVYTNGEFTIEGNSKFKKYKVEDELPDDVKSLVPINSEYVEKNKLIKKAIRAREDALFELNKMERRARDRKAKLAQGITEEEAEQTKRELAEFEEKAEKAKQEMEEAEKTIAKLEEEIKKIEKGEGSEADKLKLQQQQEADEEAERQRQQQQADEEAEKKRQQQQQEDEEAEKKRQQQQQEDEAKKNSQQEEDEKKAKDEIKDDEAQDLKNDEQQKEDEQNQQATDDDVLEDPETGERERVRARDAAIVEPTRTTSKVIEHTTRHTTL